MTEQARLRARLVAGLVAVLLGAWLLAVSWGPLQRLFADDRDNAWPVYVLFAALYAVPGLVLLALAHRLLRPHRHQQPDALDG